MHPAAARAWTSEAEAAYRAGALEAAAVLLEHSARISETAQTRYRLGLVERSRGRNEAARTCFERALQLDPAMQAAREALEGLP